MGKVGINKPMNNENSMMTLRMSLSDEVDNISSQNEEVKSSIAEIKEQYDSDKILKIEDTIKVNKEKTM